MTFTLFFWGAAQCGLAQCGPTQMLLTRNLPTFLSQSRAATCGFQLSLSHESRMLIALPLKAVATIAAEFSSRESGNRFDSSLRFQPVRALTR